MAGMRRASPAAPRARRRRPRRTGSRPRGSPSRGRRPAKAVDAVVQLGQPPAARRPTPACRPGGRTPSGPAPGAGSTRAVRVERDQVVLVRVQPLQPVHVVAHLHLRAGRGARAQHVVPGRPGPRAGGQHAGVGVQHGRRCASSGTRRAPGARVGVGSASSRSAWSGCVAMTTASNAAVPRRRRRVISTPSGVPAHAAHRRRRCAPPSSSLATRST